MDIRKELEETLTAIDRQIRHLSVTSMGQRDGTPWYMIKLVDGSYPAIPLLAARATVLNALVTLEGQDGATQQGL